MSLSTTSTAVYILSKYSRAYQSAPTSGTQDADAEWQHFTNPVIRLVLDIKKTGNGELESYRVRVIWSINAGGGANLMSVDQQEVCFEDLDLLAFSSDPLQAQNTSMAVHGLPLRAVYREGVVGIRYLHPRVVPVGGTPTYRRLQMSFQNMADASAFIDAIRVVCPCKANPPPQAPLARANTMAIHPRQASSAKTDNTTMPPPRFPASATPALRPTMSVQAPPGRPLDVSRTSALAEHAPPKQPPTLKASTSMLPPPEPRPTLRQSATMGAQMSTDYMRSPAASQLPQPAANTRTVYGTPSVPVYVPVSLRSSSVCPAPASSASTAPPNVTARAPVSSTFSTSVSSTAASAALNSDLPFSSPPTPSPNSGRKHLFVSEAETVMQASTPPAAQPTTNVPQDVPMDIDVQEAPPQINGSAGDTRPSENNKPDAPFMESLLKLPSLYELSRSDLEALVAEVIREEEFAKLLQDLDSMWRIKALLG